MSVPEVGPFRLDERFHRSSTERMSLSGGFNCLQSWVQSKEAWEKAQLEGVCGFIGFFDFKRHNSYLAWLTTHARDENKAAFQRDLQAIIGLDLSSSQCGFGSVMCQFCDIMINKIDGPMARQRRAFSDQEKYALLAMVQFLHCDLFKDDQVVQSGITVVVENIDKMPQDNVRVALESISGRFRESWVGYLGRHVVAPSVLTAISSASRAVWDSLV